MASTDLARIAHILRRTTFGPHPGQVEAYAKLGVRGTLDALLRGPETVFPASVVGRASFTEYDTLIRWWIDQARTPQSGVHEKLVWYWHGHFTSSRDKCDDVLLWRQHHLLRTHALGNFRDLVQAITVDGAMLAFLDGSGSHGDAPNENYARELMEVFCLGPGEFTEDDVRAAARAFAGWVIDEHDAVVERPEARYDRPVTFLGTRQRWDARSVVDAVVDHPACARHVARRLWAFYVATPLTDGRLDALAKTFRDAKLEIRPLLESILRSDEFLDSAHARARQPVEWLLAAAAATGPASRELQPYWFDQLGQSPFRPPNVAGWPLDDRWSSAGQIVQRTSIAMALGVDASIVDAVAPDPDAVLAHCGLHDASAETRAALADALRRQTEYDRGLELLLALAIQSPEFSLA